MACSAEGSSSAVPEAATNSATPSFANYDSMLKRIYLHHKETDAVIRYLEECENKPFLANESATIVNFRAGMAKDVVHYSCPDDNGTSGSQCLPQTSPTWAVAFQENVEKVDNNVAIRFILLSKVSCGQRSLSAWIINYFGLYLGLEPGFFFALIDADGDFMPENIKPRGGPFQSTTLYMEGHCFVICSTKEERMMAGPHWRPRIILAFIVDTTAFVSEVNRLFLADLPKRLLPAEDGTLKPCGVLHSQIMDLLMEAQFSNSDQAIDSIAATVARSFPRAFSRMLWAYIQHTRNKFDMLKRIQEDPIIRGLPSAIHNDELLIKEWKILHHTLGRHRVGYSNFTRWLQSLDIAVSNYEKAASELLKTELDDVLEDGHRLELEMRERMQVHVAAMSLKESRKGIQQATSVGRLTQLAFLFIPLTFTTGVFGMNVESLKNGAPLWKFWVTATTVSLGAFVFMALIGRVERRVQIWQHLAQEEEISLLLYVTQRSLSKIKQLLWF